MGVGRKQVGVGGINHFGFVHKEPLVGVVAVIAVHKAVEVHVFGI